MRRSGTGAISSAAFTRPGFGRTELGSEPSGLDEVFLKMNGVQHYLWRAVDQNGVVIDILVQPRRDRWAALRFFHKLLHTAGTPPRVIVTDKLRSYAAAKRLLWPNVTHRQSRYLNNRAENSHQPTRMRERQMKRFQSPRKLNASCRFSSRSILTFECAAIFSLPLATGNYSGRPFNSGVKLLAGRSFPRGSVSAYFFLRSPSLIVSLS